MCCAAATNAKLELAIYPEGAAMTLEKLIMLPIVILLFGFVVFAFRQGFKVKPNRSGAPPEETTLWRHPDLR
jgi:hypothetical protein